MKKNNVKTKFVEKVGTLAKWLTTFLVGMMMTFNLVFVCSFRYEHIWKILLGIISSYALVYILYKKRPSHEKFSFFLRYFDMLEVFDVTRLLCNEKDELETEEKKCIELLERNAENQQLVNDVKAILDIIHFDSEGEMNEKKNMEKLYDTEQKLMDEKERLTSCMAKIEEKKKQEKRELELKEAWKNYFRELYYGAGLILWIIMLVLLFLNYSYDLMAW